MVCTTTSRHYCYCIGSRAGGTRGLNVSIKNMETTQLTIELQQLNEYARHEITVYVSWFTFFLTLLLAAMGWSLKASLNSQGVVRTPTPFFCMIVLFTMQLIFAVWGTRYVKEDLRKADERCAVLLALAPTTSATSYKSASPIPAGYHVVLGTMQWVLVSHLIFWPVVAILVWSKRGKVLSQASAE